MYSNTGNDKIRTHYLACFMMFRHNDAVVVKYSHCVSANEECFIRCAKKHQISRELGQKCRRYGMGVREQTKKRKKDQCYLWPNRTLVPFHRNYPYAEKIFEPVCIHRAHIIKHAPILNMTTMFSFLPHYQYSHRKNSCIATRYIAHLFYHRHTALTENLLHNAQNFSGQLLHGGINWSLNVD